MASSGISFPHTNFQQRKLFPIERRPRTLKDFLNENSNSCSSSWFKSFHRQPFQPNVIETIKIQRQMRLKAASSPTISAFQAVINAVKNITFTTVKSPSFLPRSLSRRLSKKETKKNQEKANQGKTTASVRIKDILRWKSFRDLVDQEISPPVDFTPSPNHHCTTTTSFTTGSTTDSSTSACNSYGSSWCDSDFTAQLSPSWRGNSNSDGFDGDEIDDDLRKIQNNVPCVSRDSKAGKAGAEDYTAVGPKVGELLFGDENEQQSPVSVLDFHFREDENPLSTFDQSLDSMNRTNQKLMQKINWFESLAKLEPVDLDKWTSMEESSIFEEERKDEDEGVRFGGEERARELLYHDKETSSTVSRKTDVDQLLLDFFKYKLSERNNQTEDDDFNFEMVRIAEAWMNGEHEVLEWGLEYKREAYIRHMHKLEKWSKFEDEQEELALEIEAGILNHLVDELLVDYS
ncbi:uncharacterized protein LOC107432662 [Ziziphus jujuba]|uniref:Uncharacterized protein LOC107432662 n=1 Tax=Ziziphus jujuba TaxID=326968 RepID=A0ABM3I599_ZIZJJ|nr:uncharacterized protein LOC107432662 [Ziziphus jujuba]